MVIDNQLSDKVATASFALEGVTVRERSDELEQAIAERIHELRERYAEPAAAQSALAAARELYHRCGMDPSKHRPSSEALLRRVLQGKGLYTVNTAVDAANLASLSILLPVGLYDLGRVASREGAVVLRAGLPGESYPGIGKADIHLEARPALVDDAGPFGNPSADSFRTRVTPETRALLFVAFAPAGHASADLERCRSISSGILRRFVAGREIPEALRG